MAASVRGRFAGALQTRTNSDALTFRVARASAAPTSQAPAYAGAPSYIYNRLRPGLAKGTAKHVVCTHIS